ncbi:MAG: hypothetical protein HRT67_05410 [Flavobacteriaceae bacterium]|nr:hypothetical protein [Flavobacteriaceae bacterium]
MNKRIVLITLWLLCIIGMILHFNYHIGEIFYGIDIIRPDANGQVPMSVFVIRTLFYHLPIIWILCIIYFEAKPVKLGLFILSVLYAFAHASHLMGEIKNESIDPSQLSVLSIVLLIAVILVIEHYKYWKSQGNN